MFRSLNISSRYGKSIATPSAFRRLFATPQAAVLNRDMGQHQWYVHLSREDSADLNTIRSALRKVREESQKNDVNLVISFGPKLLEDLLEIKPHDFQPFETIKSQDGSGREAKGTQEELLLWFNSPRKDVVWKTQYDVRQALKGHMKVARETPTFIYGDSLDMTGFTDGTGNPAPEEDVAVAVVPDGKEGEGGSFVLAQRWVHDLQSWEKLPVSEQEGVFGRTKKGSERLDTQLPTSHLSHVELSGTNTVADPSLPKRDQISRRSTPYAFHDGTVGLYFMAFCAKQAPFRERLQRMYGVHPDQSTPDRLTQFSYPASGSFYFAPSVEHLDRL